MFFKIITGYNPEDYIEIEQSELEKAQYCFLEKKDSIFSGGPVRGSNIMTIRPDYHKTMGWNRGHRLSAEDYEELGNKGIDRKYMNILEESKSRVEYFIKTKQEQLIGKGVEIVKIESPLSPEISALAESKRIT